MKSTPALTEMIEWDVPNWSQALSYWLAQTQLSLAGSRALEIGCGNGGLSLWAATQGLSVLCTDIAQPPPAVIEKHQHYEVSAQIQYQQLNALDIPFAEAFDVVLFKSILGGVGRDNHPERQAQAIQQIYKALKPGGELWFAENLAASPLHRFSRRRWVRWGTAWRYVTIREMHDYLSVFREFRYKTVGFLGCFGRTAAQRTALGRIDRLVDKVVPPSWRYVLIGVARK
ncbi:MAG TPA: class I SAM-dependent methyltransferase [Pirellulales bacterium]|nr:class I SAM-dependent methyltransferase [Pirellulales bacterium]